MKNANYLAYVSALLNASIVGLSFLFTKTAIMLSSPIDTLAARFTAAFITLSLLMIFKLVHIKFLSKSYYRLLPLTLFYPALFFSFQAFGLKVTPSSEGGIIFASIPIITTVLASIFIKEHTTFMQKFAIAISVFGVIFIFIMKGSTLTFSSMLGICLLLISCISISSYSVMARSLTKTFKPLEITYFMLGVGFVIFNAAAVLKHLNEGTLNSMLIPWKDLNFVGSIMFLGILASFVTSLLSNYTLSKIPASQMSVFTNLSTVISIAAGAFILHETIYYYHIIGSALIILGVLGTNFFSGSKSVRVSQSDKVTHKI